MSHGIEIEADQKHIPNLLELLGTETCNSVSCPMANDDEEEAKDQTFLGNGEAKMFRAGTALTSYLSQDRPDLSAAVCHLARMQRAQCRRPADCMTCMTLKPAAAWIFTKAGAEWALNTPPRH